MPFSYFSKNGELFPLDDATIPLSSVEYQYGFGVYETIRVHNRMPNFLANHIERLQHSARIIGLGHRWENSLVSAAVAALVEALPETTYNIKILLIGAAEPDRAELFVLPLAPLFPDKKLYRDGAAAITYPYERLFPKAKTLNMLGSYLAYRTARAAGAYDALLINRAGFITEGTRTNFFAIKDKTIFEAPADSILDGVTRQHVLEVAKESGYDLREATVTVADLSRYDSAFITSTSSKIIPLQKIDTFQFPTISGPLRELMHQFDDFLAKNK